MEGKGVRQLNRDAAFFHIDNLPRKFDRRVTFRKEGSQYNLMPFSILLQGFHPDKEAGRHRYIHHCNNIPNRVPPNMYYSIE